MCSKRFADIIDFIWTTHEAGWGGGVSLVYEHIQEYKQGLLGVSQGGYDQAGSPVCFKVWGKGFSCHGVCREF